MEMREADVAVIGAGTAGLSAFRAARAHTNSVVLIEGGAHGTTCARVGCMPSKLLIAAAEAAHGAHGAGVFGIRTGPVAVDGGKVLERVRRERDRFVGFVLESLDGFPPGSLLAGRARFRDAHRIQVEEDTVVRAARVVIATGSRPIIPPILEGVADRILTNDSLFELDHLPASCAVLGAGVIGLELGQALHRLGVRVRLFGRGGSVGPLSDPAVTAEAARIFAEEFPFHPDAAVAGVGPDADGVAVAFSAGGPPRKEVFDCVLAAAGRHPDVESLGLEAAGIELDFRGVPAFDASTLRCGGSHIFIAGDVNGHLPLLHEAADEGRIAGDNAGRYPDVRPGLRRSPLNIVFSDPQIARVGESYRMLKAAQTPFVTGEVSFHDQGRSRVIHQNRGLLRLYASREDGRFLGAEMVAPRAEHLAHLLAWSHQQGLTVERMLAMPFYHPVIEEGLRTALREAARQLGKGPPPVPRCLDCGPGA